MKSLYKISTLVVGILMCSNIVYAQNQVTSLPLISTLPQASGLNPGILPDYKFTLGLPGLMGAYVSTDMNFTSLRTLSTQTAEGNLDIENIFNSMPNRSRLTAYAELPIFHLGIRGEKSHTAFTVTNRTFARFTFPKDLVGIPAFGNDNELFRNRDISLMDLSFSANSFTEIGITHGREILPGLTAGVKIKYLIGHADVSLSGVDVNFGNYGTDSLSLRSNPFDFNMAGPQSEFLREDGGEIDFTDTRNFISGGGFAIDFGAEYRLFDRLSIFASVVDFGRISWNRNLSTWQIPGNNLLFTGVTDIFNMDGFNPEVADTIINSFLPVEIESEGYSRWLNAKIYAGASFDLTEDHTVGALMFSEIYRGTIIPAFSAFYNLQYKTNLDLVINATIMNRRVDNIGFGVTARLLGIQTFLVTNSILSFVNPLDARNLSLRVGTNINFGDINKVRGGRKNKKAGSDAIKLDI